MRREGSRQPALWIVGLAASMLASVAAGSAVPHESLQPRCEAVPQEAPFDFSRDLLIANYDIKPDVDDLHSIAAFATVAARYEACLEYLAVAGTYGMQGGDYIDAPALLRLAFGDRWIDAHADREAAIAIVGARAASVIAAGGTVWIAEGGQSDFSYALVTFLSHDAAIASRLAGQMKVVQHSDWNEQQTAHGVLDRLRETIDYVRIADGNGSGNGTPDFSTDDASWWPTLLRDPEVGPVWAEAKRLADAANPGAAYVNPDVAKDGLDFSDTVEVAHILGFAGMVDHDAFFRSFLSPQLFAPDHDEVPPVITRWMARPSLLVFSKTAGWRHDAGIAAANLFATEWADQRGWGIFTTENGAVFRPEILDRFDLIIFNNMTGDALSPAQEKAFQNWLEAGGSWVGLHGSGDNSHGDWPWFDRQLVGPEFVGHPANPHLQEARFTVLASAHPITAGVPQSFSLSDEYYSFDSHAGDHGMTALLGIDEDSYQPFNRQYGPREDLRMGPEPADHPMVWARCDGESRTFYSALGHDHRVYENAAYRKLLGNALDWVSEREDRAGCS